MKYSINKLLIDLKTASVLYNNQPDAAKVLEGFISDANKAVCSYCAKGFIAYKDGNDLDWKHLLETNDLKDRYTTCLATGLRNIICEEL